MVSRSCPHLVQRLWRWSVLRNLLVYGRIPVSASKEIRDAYCYRRSCYHEYIGGIAALASAVFAADTLCILGGGTFGYYVCLVGFSALRVGLFYRLILHAGDFKNVRLSQQFFANNLPAVLYYHRCITAEFRV